MLESDKLIPEDVLYEAVRAVLDVRSTEEGADGFPAEFTVTGPESASLESLGVDSMLVAEIIVELEQRLDKMLELVTENGIETFEQLRAALRPVASA